MEIGAKVVLIKNWKRFGRTIQKGTTGKIIQLHPLGNKEVVRVEWTTVNDSSWVNIGYLKPVGEEK